MAIQYDKIEFAFQKEDVEGLIKSGAPKDEYSDEAKELYLALSALSESELKEDNIIAIISLIWTKQFNHSEQDIRRRLPSFERIANYLMLNNR